jgi:hypothetical protein
MWAGHVGGVWPENIKGRDHFKDPAITKNYLKKQSEVLIGFSWLRERTCDGIL